MIHNIVIDEEGNEHQAVKNKKGNCSVCSLALMNCNDEFHPCVPEVRDDSQDVVYKRRIKIGDIRDLI